MTTGCPKISSPRDWRVRSPRSQSHHVATTSNVFWPTISNLTASSINLPSPSSPTPKVHSNRSQLTDTAQTSLPRACLQKHTLVRNAVASCIGLNISDAIYAHVRMARITLHATLTVPNS